MKGKFIKIWAGLRKLITENKGLKYPQKQEAITKLGPEWGERDIIRTLMEGLPNRSCSLNKRTQLLPILSLAGEKNRWNKYSIYFLLHLSILHIAFQLESQRSRKPRWGHGTEKSRDRWKVNLQGQWKTSSTVTFSVV